MAQQPSHLYGEDFTFETPIEYVSQIPLLVPIEEDPDIRHTDTRPFCVGDSSCPCHEDTTLIASVLLEVGDGLLTSDEATRTVKGEML